MEPASIQAWNNFVIHSDPASYEDDRDKRAAAIANLFMGMANNGGLNSFLTASYDLDANEVLRALTLVGALLAAGQLQEALEGLKTPLPKSSQGERWSLLEEHWSDELDQFDVLSEEANDELVLCLQRHVAENETFYALLA